LRIAEFKCALKIASGKSDGNLFVKGKSVFYWVIGILMAVIVIAAAFHFDHTMQNFIAQHQDRLANKVMHKISQFGDWPEHFVIGLVLASGAWWRGNKRWTRIFLSMLIALAIAGVVGRGIKIATARARPSVKLEEVLNRSRFSSKFHAFPSGHVAASSAFFAVLFFANWRIGLACLPIPLVIGFSRMYVGAHYLSDVVFAAILGFLSALLVTRVLMPQMEHRTSVWRRG
jgi:membrane-associated phospholipid phosphatase